MRNIIVGTAGHIDHGKTALVKALTGTDADRLAEEKRRGITIDLGFAHLQLSKDLRLGFIDVPGHERFVRNMLAGAAGIDMVLFVIAADESIKPQTREHFEICRMLGVQAGVIALTKADQTDPDLLELVRLEVDEFVAGSFLENAPKIAVSSLTGEGIPKLRTELELVARAVREKSSAGWFRLPVDRSFTMKGFGTVVTGTLISGTLSREQEVELYPTGRRLRVRGLQVYGEAALRARAGERTAVNLVDIEPGEIERGMVLSEAGRFSPVKLFDARLDLLASARPLKNNAPIHLHIGAAEIEAEVRYLDRRATLKPGASAWTRISLREPALILPGDRFIVRMFSPVSTIGGGVVADISAPKYKRSFPNSALPTVAPPANTPITDTPLTEPRPQGSGPAPINNAPKPGKTKSPAPSLQTANIAARLTTLLSGTPQARAELLVSERPNGMQTSDLLALTGLPEIPHTPTLITIGTWLIPIPRIADLKKQLTAKVRAFHKEYTLLPGIPKQDLKNAVIPEAAAEIFNHILNTAAPEVVQDGDVVRLAVHRVVLKIDEERARNTIEKAFETAGLSTPAVQDVLKASGLEPARARSVLGILQREGKLVRISDELVLHSTACARLRAELATRKGQRFAVPEFKGWTGVSRKYAIPLLEYLDREHVTRRDGDYRIIL